MINKITKWEESIDRHKERLGTPVCWYAVPFLLSAALVLIVTFHIETSTKVHLGAQSKILNLSAEKAPNTGVWLSVLKKDGKLHIRSNSSEKIIFDPSASGEESILPIVDFLNHEVQMQALSAVITRATFKEAATVLISADTSLSYGDFKPLLHALAKAKVRHYGFETKRVKL